MLPNREGQRVPQVTFRTRVNSEWRSTTTDDIFKGKTVVVFSLPGAFTPTCSSTHLPRYNELAPAFRASGVDAIVCISVNDPFVMEEWARDQESANVLLIPDGNGEFTAGMGMLVDKSDLGFGKRSWRYSMLVRDGVVEKMFIEPEKAGDPFEVSDADTMLAYVNPRIGTSFNLIAAVFMYMLYSNTLNIVQSFIAQGKLGFLPGLFIPHLIAIALVLLLYGHQLSLFGIFNRWQRAKAVAG